jgi:hypothetical protein
MAENCTDSKPKLQLTEKFETEKSVTELAKDYWVQTEQLHP